MLIVLLNNIFWLVAGVRGVAVASYSYGQERGKYSSITFVSYMCSSVVSHYSVSYSQVMCGYFANLHDALFMFYYVYNFPKSIIFLWILYNYFILSLFNNIFLKMYLLETIKLNFRFDSHPIFINKFISICFQLI